MKRFIEIITGNRENRFYKIITNWAYSWPVWVYTLFQFWRWKNQMRGSLSWPLRGCIITASLLSASGKWWGCFFGFAYGIYGICEELYKAATGQHIFFQHYSFVCRHNYILRINGLSGIQKKQTAGLNPVFSL